MVNSYCILLYYLMYVIESVDFNTRLGPDSGIPEVLDDDDNVELEKSNVLLMGPTGSGMPLLQLFFSPLFSYKMRVSCIQIACTFCISNLKLQNAFYVNLTFTI